MPRRRSYRKSRKKSRRKSRQRSHSTRRKTRRKKSRLKGGVKRQVPKQVADPHIIGLAASGALPPEILRQISIRQQIMPIEALKEAMNSVRQDFQSLENSIRHLKNISTDIYGNYGKYRRMDPTKFPMSSDIAGAYNAYINELYDDLKSYEARLGRMKREINIMKPAV